jgi:hypothetical protein
MFLRGEARKVIKNGKKYVLFHFPGVEKAKRWLAWRRAMEKDDIMETRTLSR